MPADFTDRDEIARFGRFTKGAVDTAVGFGVLGLQRLQVGRVALSRRLASHETFGPGYLAMRTEAVRRAGQVDRLFTEALRTVGSTLEPIAERLPEPARQVATVVQRRFDELHAKVSEHLADARADGQHPTDTD